MYEYIFDHPSKYLRDLSGKFPSKCLEEAREYVKIYTDKKNSYPQIYDKTVQTTNHRRLPYSQVAVGIALEETLVPKRAKAAAKANPKADIATQQANAEKKLKELIKICQTAAQEQDILEDARDRKIVGVMVEDPLYRLRQLQSQLNASQNTVNLAAELATYQTNHGSAVLIENLIKPASINGKENGLSKIYEGVRNRLDTYAIDYATAAGIRAQAKNAHSFALKRFINEYKKESNHAVLADLCSLNGFDYSGALYFIAKLATTLATQQFDPILIEMSQGKHSKTAIKTLIDTLDNEKHRLATFIWKRTTQSDDLTKPYKDQPLEENKGDGICRPTELIRLQKLQATQVMADTQFLESKLLADFATKESSSRTGAKAVGSAVLEVYSKIVESLSSAQTAYHQSRAAVIETAGAIRTNTSAQSQNQQNIDNNQQQQQTNRTQAQEIENRQTQVATDMSGIPEERTRLETERGEMGEISEEARRQENTTRRQGNQRIGQAMDDAAQAGRNAATTRAGVLAEGRQAVMNIYERAGGQLRQVHADFYPLILERTGKRLINPYQCAITDAPANDGTGKCRLPVVIQIAKYDKIPDDKNITLDTQNLNEAMGKPDTSKAVYDGLTAGSNALNSIGTGLVTTIQTNYLQLIARNRGILNSIATQRAANTQARNANTARTQAVTNLLNAGERSQIRLHGLATDRIQVQNFNLMRAFNTNTPMGNVFLDAIQEVALQETPVGRPQNAPAGTTVEVTNSSGQPMRIARDADGNIVQVNGQPPEMSNRRVLIFEGEHTEFTGRNVYGRVFDANGYQIGNGELLGDTSQAKARTGGLNTDVPAQTFIAVVYEGNSPLAALLEQERAARVNAVNAINNTHQVRTSQTAIRTQLYAERQQFLHSFTEGLRLRANNAMYRALASPHFAGAMLIYKGVGFYNEVNSFKDNYDQKGLARSLAGFTSALSDMAFAAEELAFRLARQPNFLAQWRLSANALSASGVEWRLNRTMAAIGLGNVGYLPLLQSGFALAGLISSAIDLRYAILQNDNTMTKVGLTLAVAGAALGVIAPFVGGTFLLLGPIGWAALIIAGIGAYILFKNPTPPIETWLDNGPFGHTKAESLSFLQGKDAYYRLLNLFANIQIAVKDNPDYIKARRGETFNNDKAMREAMLKSPTYLEITSMIAGLVTGEASLMPDIQYQYSSATTTMVGTVYLPANEQPEVVAKVPLDNGLRIYVSDPKKGSSLGSNYSSTYYKWAVRAQFKLTQQGRLFVFPGESNIKSEGEAYSPTSHAKPNFKEVGEIYWADEENNRAAT
ncbi:hypothetical protein DKL61_01130 [Gammaproteobacteria bacterium ESL0073]|nr:hypothetical protein DKL61_01130 [Gammaproteobacteria bacterium ESL0073]